jgi:rhodanese-related sulfurtransferase
MKTTKTFLAVSVLFSALLLSGCGAETGGSSNSEDSSKNSTTEFVPEEPGELVSVAGGEFTRLSPIELRNMKNNEDFPLVNVHIPFAGNIPGTDTSIAYNEIEQNLDKLPANKDAKLVVYCQSGAMSFDAAKTLIGLGYTNVSDLEGGMEAWQSAGFDLKDV